MKNLQLNLKKILSLRGVSLVLAGSLLAGSLTGCGSKVDCVIDGSHAHLYTDENGYVRYIQSEDGEYKGMNRQDKYIPLSSEDEQLYKFLNKNGLIRIDENIDLILEQQALNEDFSIYEYKQMIICNAVYFFYEWTNDPNHGDLTGAKKDCHYVYQAYNVVIDEKGKYVLVPSEEVTDLTSIMDDYPYVKVDYYKAVDKDGNEVCYTADIEEKKAKIEVASSSENELECNGEYNICLSKKYE